MSIVAGVDFSTLSVRVLIFDNEKGKLGAATAGYELMRKNDDPDFASQRHEDQLVALVQATKNAIKNSGISGDQVAALAIDTTGSSVVPVDDELNSLEDYYLWCDRRAKKEAAEISDKAIEQNLEHIKWCGDRYSSEGGLAKLLHWLRHNPEKRNQLAALFEHSDLIVGILCGARNPKDVKRNICAAGHKWMWNGALGGLPPQSFLTIVDPLLDGIREKLTGEYSVSNQIAGHLSSEWAEVLGLKSGIPIPVGGLETHWDAIGVGIKQGDVVNVISQSSRIMAIAKQVDFISGMSGIVRGSIHPDYYTIDAEMASTHEIYETIARRTGVTVQELTATEENYKGGQTGLLRFCWDNGDDAVLNNSNLGGMTFGWTMDSTSPDELFAAFEGTAFHTRIILERLKEHRVPIRRVLNSGAIPQKIDILNQIFANVLNLPILVQEQDSTSFGSVIFAFLAGGVFDSIEAAQKKLCPTYKIYHPQPETVEIYNELFMLYRKLYFAFGQYDSMSIWMGDVLPQLKKIADKVRNS